MSWDLSECWPIAWYWQTVSSACNEHFYECYCTIWPRSYQNILQAYLRARSWSWNLKIPHFNYCSHLGLTSTHSVCRPWYIHHLYQLSVFLLIESGVHIRVPLIFPDIFCKNTQWLQLAFDYFLLSFWCHIDPKYPNFCQMYAEKKHL